MPRSYQKADGISKEIALLHLMGIQESLTVSMILR